MNQLDLLLKLCVIFYFSHVVVFLLCPLSLRLICVYLNHLKTQKTFDAYNCLRDSIAKSIAATRLTV